MTADAPNLTELSAALFDLPWFLPVVREIRRSKRPRFYQKQLAKELGCDDQRVTGCFKRLRKLGLIEPVDGTEGDNQNWLRCVQSPLWEPLDALIELAAAD